MHWPENRLEVISTDPYEAAADLHRRKLAVRNQPSDEPLRNV